MPSGSDDWSSFTGGAMINIPTETLLTLAEAAAELPRRRRGRKTHVSTLYRWSRSGCRGVRLETVSLGATRCTSREALRRVVEELSLPFVGVDREGPRSPARCRRESAQAARELK